MVMDDDASPEGEHRRALENYRAACSMDDIARIDAAELDLRSAEMNLKDHLLREYLKKSYH